MARLTARLACSCAAMYVLWSFAAAGLAAAQPAPSVGSFTATPTALASGGGPVALSASVANATSCKLSSSPAFPGSPFTVDCSSGTVAQTVFLNANTTGHVQSYVLKITAMRGSQPTAAATATVTVDHPPAPTISSFVAGPKTLSGVGGAVTLTAGVADTDSCTFSSSPVLRGLPTTSVCYSGVAGTTVTLPANKTAKAKTYTFKLVAAGAGRSAKATSTVTVLAKGQTAPPEIIHVAGTLSSSQTWSPQGGSVYVIDDTLSVPAGVTLTIAPGTIVEIADAIGIELDGGSLQAGGTAASPVTFTSLADDSAGGGYGVGVMIASGSAVIDHAVVRDGADALDSCGDAGPETVTVTDSWIEGRLLLCGATDAVVARNTFATAGEAIRTQNLGDPTGIALSGPDTNTFTGSGIGATIWVDGGSVPAGKSWEVSRAGGEVLVISNDPLVVQGTLQLDAGTIVKIGSLFGFDVDDSGNLVSSGTAAAPVIVTNIRNDSVGGDSNGDGPSPGGGYGDAIRMLGAASGVLSIAHTRIENAQNALWVCSSGTVAVADSSFADGVWFDEPCGSPAVSIKRTTFQVTSGTAAIQGPLSDPTGIVLAGPDANTFTGSARGNTVDLKGVTVPAGKTWEISSATGAVLVEDVDPIVVKGTVALDAGAIVKLSGTDGFQLSGGGSISATGTTANPVVITGYHDDSVGGDSNGDGPSSGWETDYAWAVHVDTGPGAAPASVSFAGTQFRFGLSALAFCNPGSVSITDSTLASGIYVGGPECGGPALTLERNTFAVATGRPAISGDPVDVTGIALAGPNANTFTGGGINDVVDLFAGSVPAGKSWEVSSAAGAVVKIDAALTVRGTLTLDAGAILKVDRPGQGIQVTGIEVNGGTVLANGTAVGPVVITSLYDDSVGGDSDGTGPSVGTPGDYAVGIQLDNQSSTLSASFLDIRFATTPIRSL